MFTNQRLQSFTNQVLSELSKMSDDDVRDFLRELKAVFSSLRATQYSKISLDASLVAIKTKTDSIPTPMTSKMIDDIEKMLLERTIGELGVPPTAEMIKAAERTPGSSGNNFLQLKSGKTLWFEGVVDEGIIASGDIDVTPRIVSLATVTELDLDNLTSIPGMKIDSDTFDAGSIFRVGDELYYRSRHASIDLYTYRPLGKSEPVYLSRK